MGLIEKAVFLMSCEDVLKKALIGFEPRLPLKKPNINQHLRLDFTNRVALELQKL